MQHIEFFDSDHFENNYYRVPPSENLGEYIDYIWETKFDHLWKIYPNGFSDVLFPHIGYTYLINLGTPFVMQVNEKKFEMKTDGFLPRPNNLECFHQTGNRLFGIKFRVSPVIFEKKVDFSEYREYIFPLSYLVNQSVIDRIKKTSNFYERVNIVCTHYTSLVNQHADLERPVQIVTEILDTCAREQQFSVQIESLAQKYKVSSRTLQRYFETATGISGKKALQILRIRSAVSHIARDPDSFHFSQYGYYDHSHFYKHLKQFLKRDALLKIEPHLEMLRRISSAPNRQV